MRIVIDAGHGPNTAGKRCPNDSMREYTFNAATARYAIEQLRAYEGVELLTTFEDGRDVPINERYQKANSWGADILVSIHANGWGSTWNDANGIETLVDYRKPSESVKLAKIIQTEMVKATGLRDRGLLYTDQVGILNYSKMVRVLVECGFMTNRVEAVLLKSDAYRQKCAAAIIKGIVAYAGLKLKEVDYMLAKSDADILIKREQTAWAAAKAKGDTAAMKEANRMANELRKASGQALQ